MYLATEHIVTIQKLTSHIREGPRSADLSYGLPVVCRTHSEPGLSRLPFPDAEVCSASRTQ